MKPNGISNCDCGKHVGFRGALPNLLSCNFKGEGYRMNIPIARLIPQPGGKQLEFKRDLSSPQPIMKNPHRFCQSCGGCLIIDIADNGRYE